MNERFCISMLVIALIAGYAPHALGQNAPENLVDPALLTDGLRTGDNLLIPLRGKNVLAWEISHNGQTVVVDGDAPFYELIGFEEGRAVTVTAIGIGPSQQLVRVPVRLQSRDSDCFFQAQFPDTRLMPAVPGSEIFLRVGKGNADTATIDGVPMLIDQQSGIQFFYTDYVAQVDERVTAILTGNSGQSECFWDLDVLEGPPIQILSFLHEPMTFFNDRADFETPITLIMRTNEFAVSADVDGVPMAVTSVDGNGDKTWELEILPEETRGYRGTILNNIGEFQNRTQFVYVEDPPEITSLTKVPNLSMYAYDQIVQLRVFTDGDSAEIDGVPMNPLKGSPGFFLDYAVSGDEIIEAIVRTDEGGGARVEWEVVCGVPVFAGADRDVCGYVQLAGEDLSGAGGGVWSEVSGDGAGVFSDINDPNSQFSGTPGVVYELAWSVDGDPCDSHDTMMVDFFDTGFPLDVDGQPGLSSNDYDAVMSLWGTALTSANLDDEGIGRVNILTLMRVDSCFPDP